MTGKLAEGSGETEREKCYASLQITALVDRVHRWVDNGTGLAYKILCSLLFRSLSPFHSTTTLSDVHP